uniref:Uncharacterized protein n=1 Tax=Magallana gigas TaxID=29159 RepID=K1QWJ8_MAGGI
MCSFDSTESRSQQKMSTTTLIVETTAISFSNLRDQYSIDGAGPPPPARVGSKEVHQTLHPSEEEGIGNHSKRTSSPCRHGTGLRRAYRALAGIDVLFLGCHCQKKQGREKDSSIMNLR